jgi:hypothetical protein
MVGVREGVVGGRTTIGGGCGERSGEGATMGGGVGARSGTQEGCVVKMGSVAKTGLGTRKELAGADR